MRSLLGSPEESPCGAVTETSILPSASSRAARGGGLFNRSDRACKRARQEPLRLAEPSGAAPIHHLPPTLQPWNRGSPATTGGVSPKEEKKKTVPRLPLQSGVLCSPSCCRTGTKCSPCAAEGTLRGQQGVSINSQCRRICTALLKPAHHRGSGAHQQEGREAKVSNMPPSCFLPCHWLQHPQARGLSTGLGLWIKPAPEDVVGKEQTSSSLLVPPQLPQHPFMPAVGSGSPLPPGHGSRLIPHRHHGPVPLAEWFGTPLCPCPWGLRTPGSCPCAPYPDHHPGSAAPERRRTRQLQRGSARHRGHQRIPAGCTAGSFPGTLLESPPSC